MTGSVPLFTLPKFEKSKFGNSKSEIPKFEIQYAIRVCLGDREVYVALRHDVQPDLQCRKRNLEDKTLPSWESGIRRQKTRRRLFAG